MSDSDFENDINERPDMGYEEVHILFCNNNRVKTKMAMEIL